ncbi:SAV_2336 N-terminal domain-related protein [Streptomyces sp. NPDC048200]|uniref:SAV_2336 N-terminal domain-related protein n=1 Tax=Streptomyces sp. NPDC048200 TaxID=3365512 RepID=UPI003710B391
MIDRLRRVLDDLGYPLSGDDLLDILLLARVMDKAGVTDADTSSPDPARAVDADRLAEDPGEDDIDGQDLGPRDMERAPARPAVKGAEGQRRFLFPGGPNTGPAAGTGGRAVRLPSPRALPGAHSLARSLRPLRQHQDHPYRRVLDVEATLRLTAETGALDVVLRPDRELRHSALLLVDDSLSMRVWRSLVPEISGLLVRSGTFRTVRTSRFIPHKLSPPRHSDGVAASVVFLLTDGVHPGWTSAATAVALAGWGARGPVAVLNPLPRRLWRATRFRPQPHLFRTAQRFPTARQLLMLDPLTGDRVERLEGDGLALPVLSLSPASMSAWTQLLTGPAVPRLVEAATLPSLGADADAPAAPAGEPPGRLVDVFRGSFSPQAYRLAVRLSALEPPLSPLLMQIVRAAALPEATSAHVAEVLLGGLLERVDDERTLTQVPESLRRDGLYAFRPGVRELLASALSRTQSQEITEAVGRALKPYLGRLPDFTALVADASGTIGLPEHASPFAVMANSTVQEKNDGEQTSGTPTQAEVAKVSGVFGRALLRASAGAVAADARSGSLITLLIESYTRTLGHRPSASQVRSWERVLPSLAECLLDAALPEVEMLIEFALPTSSGRVDVVLAGLDPLRAAPSYMIIELKLWTSAERDGSDTGLCIVDTSPSPVLAPVDQVRRYRDYLVQFNTVLARNPERVSAAVYLPNANEFGVQSLRYDDGQEDCRLFTFENRREFITYLRSRFVSGHSGVEAADELLLGKDLPPTRLTAVAAQEVRAQGQFILLDQQEVASRTVLDAVRRSRRSEHKEVVVITGGPGTGKSAVALHLLGELYRQGVPALHATGSQSFTESLRKRVGTRRTDVRELFRFFNSFTEERENSLDVLICDEAHRIRETSANRYTKPSALTGRSQIDELIDVARVSVFLLDELQAVRPGETGSTAEIVRVAQSKGVPVRVVSLNSQFGCGGSEAYLHWASRLAGLERGGPIRWEPDGRMQALIADSPQDMEAFLVDRRNEGYAARMTAGYCWPWTTGPSPGEALPLDVVIGDWARAWSVRGSRSVSGAPPGALWASDPAGFGQVGSVYTAQGFEFDWSGVVIGPDLVWRHNRFVTDRTSSRDPSLRKASDAEADRMIRSAYRVLLTRSMVGTVIYSPDAATRAKLLELTGQAVGAKGRRAGGDKRLSTIEPEKRTTRNGRTASHDVRDLEGREVARAKELEQRKRAEAREKAGAERRAKQMSDRLRQDAALQTAEVETRVDRLMSVLHARPGGLHALRLGVHEAFEDGGSEGLTGSVEAALSKIDYPEGLRGRRRAGFAPEAKELLLEVDLPGQVVVPAVTQYRYKASVPPTIVAQPRKEAECKALYRDLVARLALRAIAEAFAVTPPSLVHVVAFNGHVSTKDHATGKTIRPCLVSLRASREMFDELVLDEPELDPVQSLRFLNAIVSQHPYDLEAVRPVVTFDLAKYKLAPERDVVAGMDSRPDLVTLDPIEFEHLIRRLFEKIGLKSWVTQASHDDGVDAVAVNEEPLIGGPCIIQVKRSKNAVPAEAVRALAGVMHDKAVTKGIIVTTAWFGKASWDFAQRSGGIELIDGRHLKALLLEHLGIDALIGLPESPQRGPISTTIEDGPDSGKLPTHIPGVADEGQEAVRQLLDRSPAPELFVRFLEETTRWDNVCVYGIKRKNALPDAALDYSSYLRLRRQGSQFGGFAYAYAEYSSINLRLSYSQQQLDELGIKSARIRTTGNREYRVSVDLTDETSLLDALQLAELAYTAT